MSRKSEQKTLQGSRVAPGIKLDKKHTTTLTFFTAHFYLRVSKDALANIREIMDAAKRKDRLTKKVRPLPDVEDIPRGAKAKETKELIAAALTN